MANMKKDDIEHLARLARIELTSTEVEKFTAEIQPILDYVSQINEIVADTTITKKVGAVHNVFREDVVTNPAGTYGEVLKAEMPERSGEYLKVKPILNQDN